VKQILVDLYDKEGNNTLDKSLTKLVNKANQVIAAINDCDKPKNAKVEVAYKT